MLKKIYGNPKAEKNKNNSNNFFYNHRVVLRISQTSLLAERRFLKKML